MERPAQTDAAAAAASRGAQIESKLVRELVHGWGWGKYSAAEVQRMCFLALKDQEELLDKIGASRAHIQPSLIAVAGIGSSGKYPGNAHRELVAYLGEPVTAKATKVPVPIRVGKPGRLSSLQTLDMGIILPHVEFATIYRQNRDVFNRMILGIEDGSDDALRAFWSGLLGRGDPRLAGHPMRARPNWEQNGVPLAIHGDGVACISVGRPGAQSLDTVSWASIVASGTTLMP